MSEEIRMKRVVGFLLASLAFMLLQASSIAAVAPAENAATYYRQALEKLPKASGDRQVYDKWGEVALNPAVVELIGRLEPSLSLLHRGSAEGQIDWGWNYAKGMGLKMPELNQSRELSRAAALDIRYLLEKKQHKQAVQVAVDLMVLGRRLQQGRAVVAWLVGYGVEMEGIVPLAAYLPQLPPEALRQLQAAVDALPKPVPMGNAVSGDKEMTLTSIRNAGLVRDDPVAAEVPQDPGQQVELMQEVRRLWDEAANVAAMPPDQAAHATAALKQKLEAASPAAQRILMKDPAKLAFYAAKAGEDRLLFRVAIAVVQAGPNALKSFNDPYGDGPFIYLQRPAGFELRSHLMNREEPVTLKVGPEALQ